MCSGGALSDLIGEQLDQYRQEHEIELREYDKIIKRNRFEM